MGCGGRGDGHIGCGQRGRRVDSDVGGGVLQRPHDASTTVEAIAYRGSHLYSVSFSIFINLSVREGHEPIIRNRVSNFRLNRFKYIRVKKKFRGNFEFSIKWSLPSKVVRLQRQPFNSILVVDQYKRLYRGRILRLKNLFTIKNIFHFCLYEQIPDGYRAVNVKEGAHPDTVLPTKRLATRGLQ
ncbi:hypothetical protein GOBAR_AA03054 [Gossypium barbadense]|uniref:Uncharacterized protein n=1 Tax=Gossypium barbadense TaxID=3634 RepID=A0A2P5YPL4_GOSBA|nr:hypothetical protein GOBAR_AA03054 [Gossypium barbadense]